LKSFSTRPPAVRAEPFAARGGGASRGRPGRAAGTPFSIFPRRSPCFAPSAATTVSSTI
jgi:hypothetical protein